MNSGNRGHEMTGKRRLRRQDRSFTRRERRLTPFDSQLEASDSQN